MISRPAAVFSCVLLLAQAGPSPAARPNGTEQVLDPFRYADAASARKAWTAAEGTPPVDISSGNGGSPLLLTAPFGAQPKLSRAV